MPYKEAGCEKYFSDKITGSKFERKGLEELLAFVRLGDTVIVWKLDRLGRSLKDLIETLNILKESGVDFISLTEKIDTTTPGGKLIFHLFLLVAVHVPCVSRIQAWNMPVLNVHKLSVFVNDSGVTSRHICHIDELLFSE